MRIVRKIPFVRFLFRSLMLFSEVIGWVIIIFIAIALAFFVYFNLPVAEPKGNVSMGVTFSARFARDLGLDPRATLDAVFSDLGVKRLRIPVYWDMVESEKGLMDWSDIDWQIDAAEHAGAEVILAVGQKVPRWPECFVPKWATTDGTVKDDLAARFIRTTIERYRDRPGIVMWQVENEPFLAFGICPPITAETLDREIATVREADPSRPILTTDSGELSFWIPAASRGDVFGTTLYRKIWKDGVGYITYPIGPNFFRFKESLTRLFTNQQKFIVIELQGEPWAPGSFSEIPLSEQWKTMDAKRLAGNVRYAKQAGFSEVYLWGVEWWYWLKEYRETPSLWETARDIFRNSTPL